jgi:hypothetical protein
MDVWVGRGSWASVKNQRAEVTETTARIVVSGCRMGQRLMNRFTTWRSSRASASSTWALARACSTSAKV